MLTKLLILALLLTSFNGFANNKVTLAVENSWPPYSDEFGNGLSKDIIKKAYQQVGVTVEFVVVPYARALHMVEHGLVDGAFNVTRQQNTEVIFNFGDKRILQAKASFYYHKNSKFNYATAREIPKGTSIALILGYEYGNAFEQQKRRFDEVRVYNQKQIIELLLSNKVDMAIMFDEVALYTLNKMGLKSSAIKQGQLNHQSDIYVAFSKKKPTQRMMMLLDRGLKKINP